MPSELSGKRVLVTGGTGFIGGRLVERLHSECGAKVRVMLRSYSNAARIGRFPVEMALGALDDPDAIKSAVAGCDVVLHCAYGSRGGREQQRRDTVDGTRWVLEAALQHRVQRVVHVSTINVYGPTSDGDVDESAPRQKFGDPYSDTKLEAEELALEMARSRGCPVSVVQPTVVYGPWGPAWTVRILSELKTGRVMLIDGGDGLCNAVHVDDVVNGMLAAATAGGAVGEAFLLSGPEPVTWRQFYGAYERMLGVSATIEVSAAEAEARFRRFKRKGSLVSAGLAILAERGPARQRIGATAEVAVLRSLGRRVVPAPLRRALRQRLTGGGNKTKASATVSEPPVHLMSPASIRVAASKTRFRIDKASRLLGHRPAVSFEAGMGQVAAWAEWANLLRRQPDVFDGIPR